jgi:hypothetical protein
MTDQGPDDGASGTVLKGTAAPSPLLNNWQVFFPPGVRVVALPSWSRPRLLLPETSLGELAAASGFYPAFRIRGRLFHLLLRVKAVLAIGAAQTASDRPPFVSQFLANALPEARVRAVQVGMRGSARKCTLQLADRSGRVVGYIKCAESTVARQRLKDEFDLLTALPPGVGPVPIKYGCVGSYDALLLDVVPGRPLRPVVPPTREVRDFSASLTRAEFHSIESHPWVQGRAYVSDVLRRFLELLAHRDWPAAIQHGDFAPWNVMESAERKLTAIDWEYGTLSGFPALDLAHYVLQVTGLIRRWRPPQAREYAIGQLMQDDHLQLTRTEAAALVCMAAHQAYETTAIEGHAPTDWAQVWRRGVWEGAI